MWLSHKNCFVDHVSIFHSCYSLSMFTILAQNYGGVCRRTRHAIVLLGQLCLVYDDLLLNCVSWERA